MSVSSQASGTEDIYANATGQISNSTGNSTGSNLDSHTTGSNAALSYAGGIVGKNESKIENSHTSSVVKSNASIYEGTASTWPANGTTSHIKNSVTATYIPTVGGIAGSSSSSGNINNCYSTGSLSTTQIAPTGTTVSGSTVTATGSASPASTTLYRSYTVRNYGIIGSGYTYDNSFWLKTTATSAPVSSQPAEYDAFDGTYRIYGGDCAGTTLGSQLFGWVDSKEKSVHVDTKVVTINYPDKDYYFTKASDAFGLSQWIISDRSLTSRINLYIEGKLVDLDSADSIVTFYDNFTGLENSNYASETDVIKVVIDPSKYSDNPDIAYQKPLPVEVNYAVGYANQDYAADILGELKASEQLEYDTATNTYFMTFTMPKSSVSVNVTFSNVDGLNCDCCKKLDIGDDHWIGISDAEEFAKYTQSSGYFFLQDDIDLGSAEGFDIATGDNVYLCLNGYKLETKNDTYLLNVTGTGVLTICGSEPGSVLENNGIGSAVLANNSAGTELTICGSPIIQNGGLKLGSGTYVTLLSGTRTANSIYVVTSSSDNKIAVAGDDYALTSADAAAFYGEVVGDKTGVAFYRVSQDAIFLAKVDPTPDDFVVSFNLGQIYNVVYNGEAHSLDGYLLDDLTNANYLDENGIYNAAFKAAYDADTLKLTGLTFRYVGYPYVDKGVLYDSTVAPTEAGIYEVFASVTNHDHYTDVETLSPVATLNILQKPVSTGEYEIYIVGQDEKGQYTTPYNGYTQEPEIIVTIKAENSVTGKAVVLVEGLDYTLTYADHKEVGTARVTVTPLSTSNYVLAEDYRTFEITGKTVVLDVVTSAKDGILVYGDPLNIEVTPTAGDVTVTGFNYGAYKVTAYAHGETLVELTYDKGVYPEGKYVGSYDSVEKGLVIDENEITIVFEGDGSSFEYKATTIDIILEPKTLNASVKSGQSKVYDGNNEFTGDLTILDIGGADALEGKDNVTLTVSGFLESALVGKDNRFLSLDTVHYDGEDAGYYILPLENIDFTTQVEIEAKDLASEVDKNFHIQVLYGIGTYVEPTISYEDFNGEEVIVSGILTYKDTTYNEIVSVLKELPARSTHEVTYTFVADDTSNYSNTTFTGKIIFSITDIAFSNIDQAIVIADTCIYGNMDNLVYDPSKFVANIGNNATTTGVYNLTIKDSYNADVTDEYILNAGVYTYFVTFTSYDGAFVGSFVTDGTFEIIPRTVEIEWDSHNFVYNSLAQKPTATVINTVWTDDIGVYVTTQETAINVGDYVGVLSLVGADRNNYQIGDTTVSYTITPVPAQGIVTLTITDTDGSGTVSITDVINADISGISPAGGTVFYQWYVNNVIQTNGVHESFILINSATIPADAEIHCVVTFSGNMAGTFESTSVVVGDDFFQGTVAITHLLGELTATVSDANTNDYTIYWSGTSSVGSGTSYTLKEEDYGNTVLVTVVANETSGFSGSFSSSISVESTKPFIPAIEVKPGDESAYVSWETPFHGGTPLQDYTLTVIDKDGNHAYGSPFTIGSTLKSFTVTGLENDLVYTFKLIAKNAQGTSASEEVTAVPRSSSDSETEDDVIVSTTTTTYVDDDGNNVTEKLVVETDLTDYSVKTTLTTTTEGRDGSVTVEKVMEKVSNTGEILESSRDYSYTEENLKIVYNTYEDSYESYGDLTATVTNNDNVKLPTSMVEMIHEKGESTVTIVAPSAEITFDDAALAEIWATVHPDSDSTFEVIARYSSPELFPASLHERFGSAFVVDLIVKVDGVEVNDFGAGKATVTLPYQRSDLTGHVNVYHVATNGVVTSMPDTIYRNTNYTVTFTTNHFSYYAVIEEAGVFFDVSPTDYFYNAVVWAVETGISSGTNENYYSPYEISNRAQVMTMLWSAAGKPATSFDPGFVDVNPDDYYYTAVNWAFQRGVTAGFSDEFFGAMRECDRAQIVTFLWNISGKPVVDDELYFSDVAVGSWYADAVRWAVSEGITAGTTASTFEPFTECTRAEVVTFIYAFLGK